MEATGENYCHAWIESYDVFSGKRRRCSRYAGRSLYCWQHEGGFWTVETDAYVSVWKAHPLSACESFAVLLEIYGALRPVRSITWSSELSPSDWNKSEGPAEARPLTLLGRD